MSGKDKNIYYSCGSPVQECSVWKVCPLCLADQCKRQEPPEGRQNLKCPRCSWRTNCISKYKNHIKGCGD